MRPTLQEIELAIQAATMRRLKRKMDESMLDPEAPLLDAGLTSFDLVAIVLSIENDFAIKFPDEELGPANFKSINSIVKITQRMTNGQTDFQPSTEGDGDIE